MNMFQLCSKLFQIILEQKFIKKRQEEEEEVIKERLVVKVIRVKDKEEPRENMDLKVDKHHYKYDYLNLV